MVIKEGKRSWQEQRAVAAEAGVGEHGLHKVAKGRLQEVGYGKPNCRTLLHEHRFEKGYNLRIINSFVVLFYETGFLCVTLGCPGISPVDPPASAF